MIEKEGFNSWDYCDIKVKFLPLRTDDLKPVATKCIGKEYLIASTFWVEHGYYADTLGVDLKNLDGSMIDEYLGWIPECDLQIVTEGG
jgi:hypothetical protein